LNLANLVGVDAEDLGPELGLRRGAGIGRGRCRGGRRRALGGRRDRSLGAEDAFGDACRIALPGNRLAGTRVGGEAAAVGSPPVLDVDVIRLLGHAAEDVRRNHMIDRGRGWPVPTADVGEAGAREQVHRPGLVMVAEARGVVNGPSVEHVLFEPGERRHGLLQLERCSRAGGEKLHRM
jgi:hypothetical protein